MKRWFLIVYLFPAIGFAQFEDYFKALPQDTPVPNLNAVSKLGDQYKITQFYSGGALASIHYQNKIDLVYPVQYAKQFTTFYPNGNVKKSRLVDKGKVLLVENYEDGRLYREISTDAAGPIVQTVNAPDGSQLVMYGLGKSVELNDYGPWRLVETGEYREGKRVGEWKIYKDGAQIATEKYKSGRLASGTSYNKFKYKKKWTPAELTAGKFAIEQELGSFLQESSMDIIFTIQISAEGKLQSYQLHSSIPLEIAILLDVMLKSPKYKWSPAKVCGVPIESEEIIKISTSVTFESIPYEPLKPYEQLYFD